MSYWKITEKNHLATISKALDSNYQLNVEESREQRLTVLDDFDRHIWRAGSLLVRRDEKQYQLYRGQQVVAEVSASPGGRFWWQLPIGDLTEQLKGLIGLRAFLPHYTCQVQTTTGAVRNQDEKIVARLNSTSLVGDAGGYHSLVEIIPLRGYQDDLRQISRLLETLAVQQASSADLRGLLLDCGLQVSYPASKPAFNLDPQEPAEAAVLRMAVSLVKLARQQEGGILEDIDTEFVHQYRVNIRKARSLVSLFKKSLSAERFERLRAELKEIGSTTNMLRDLDVLLLDYDYFCNLLPEDFRPGLEQIFSRIRRRRAQVLKQTVTRLSGEAYRSRMAELLDSLQAPAELTTPQGAVAIRELVARKVLRQYRKICTAGLAIDSDTPDEGVHELRIEGKKLRYLLELFAELFPKGQVRKLVAWLKKLQDNLGRFNDYSVQGDFLREYGRRSKPTPEQLASINRLVSVLYSQQLKERRQVEANIAAFTAEDLGKKFQRLFAVAPEKKA